MEFGINVNTGDNFEKFLKVVHDVGITRVKTTIDLNDINNDHDFFAKIIKQLKKKKVKSYITLFKATPDLFNDWDVKLAVVKLALDVMSKTQIAGVGLVEDIHTILRRGTSRRGIPKDLIVARLNELSAVIKERGHKVVFNMRADDIQGGLWSEVDFDIYDIDMFLSPNAMNTIDKLEVDRPMWFGKAGKFGGYINPTIQRNVVRKIKELGEGVADVAFLWSKEGETKFSWSEKQQFKIAASEVVQ